MKTENMQLSELSENRRQLAVAAICLLIGTLGRVMPHVANVTPMTSLSLFAGSKLSRGIAVVTLLVTLVISDALLALIYGYPLFSSWTFFVYSGFALIALWGKFFMPRFTWQMFPLRIGAATLFFWLWTNGGVWLTTAVYAKNFAGLFACYVVALPFLRNALVGDFIWGTIIFGAFIVAKNRREWRNWQTRWI
jgi:hypothetical protein